MCLNVPQSKLCICACLNSGICVLSGICHAHTPVWPESQPHIHRSIITWGRHIDREPWYHYSFVYPVRAGEQQWKSSFQHSSCMVKESQCVAWNTPHLFVSIRAHTDTHIRIYIAICVLTAVPSPLHTTPTLTSQQIRLLKITEQGYCERPLCEFGWDVIK